MFLQEGEVERLGRHRTMKVDVRVLAATNKDLDKAIEAGDFREDLFFRLSVIPIQVPPLAGAGGGYPGAGGATSDRLFSARTTSSRRSVHRRGAGRDESPAGWRGNIRELRNSVERLLVMTPGQTRST